MIKFENRLELICNLVDVFEDFLEDKNIIIQSSLEQKMREDPDYANNSAILYGDDFDSIFSGIESVLDSYNILEPYSKPMIINVTK